MKIDGRHLVETSPQAVAHGRAVRTRQPLSPVIGVKDLPTVVAVSPPYRTPYERDIARRTLPRP